MEQVATSDESRFFCDEMLGRLARELRLIGLDVEYRRGIRGMQAYREARGANRVFLTRNKRLGKLPGAYFVTAQTAPQQVSEVREKFATGTSPEAPRMPSDRALSRCLVCNETLVSISREQARPLVPFFIYQIHHEFSRCPRCRRVYWPGSHAKDMVQRVAARQPDVEAMTRPRRRFGFGRRPRHGQDKQGTTTE
ncbi:MAG: Mut7-C RNAse domain-containing protein [candidate division WOR-3 bacterium]